MKVYNLWKLHAHVWNDPSAKKLRTSQEEPEETKTNKKQL